MRRSAFLALAAAAPVAALATDRAVHVAVLGDSLALATGASRADGGFIFPAFRRVLAAHPGSTLVNVAIGGSTAADVLRLQAPRLRALAPDVVVVCAGGNDVVRRTATGAFAHTYHALLARLRSASPHLQLICCGVPDVAVSPIFADERAAVAKLARADDDAVRAAARASGATFVDLYAVKVGQADDVRFFSRDRFHPSDAGYALFFAAFAPALDAVAARAARYGA
jgi:lysophospholipase L1-like esterase